MKTLKQLERLRKAHLLINSSNTGNPTEFAAKLKISKRLLHSLLEYLKEIDAPLLYCRKSNSYYYEYAFDLLVNISVQVLVKEELKTVYAGRTILNNNLYSARFVHCTNLH
ncbi:MAG: DNA-binding protein [Flavobacteriaceae bacterium]|nr:MAG: DNA-binding protein [Flavobacteriaceae bacterium]